MKSLILFFGFKTEKAKNVEGQSFTGTAIVYMSKHGTTGKVASRIKELLIDEDVALINLNEQKRPDLSQCKRVIIGGSIHMGKVQRELQEFCRQNLEVLKTKNLGLFLCCMYDGEKATEQFNNAFPEELREAAKTTALMGYELYFDRMNFIERAMTKKITGYSEFKSQIDQGQLERFARELKKMGSSPTL